MSEILLSPYNGQLDLRHAYTYNRNQIYEFLEDVCIYPAFYSIPANDAAVLRTIYVELSALRFPDGQDYGAAGLTPDQHINRTLNPAWPPTRVPVQISKFRVSGHEYSGLKYWSPFDLLGLFLSTMGRAPTGATRRNFYLPLTAMYGRWCSIIGDPHPYMFQCTWRQQTGQADKFFLGASLSGYNADKTLTGTWKYVLTRARFRLLDGERFRLTNWSFKNCPVTRERRGHGQRFGTCAETYPFLKLLKNHDPNTEQCHGIALSKFVLRAQQYDDSLSGHTWKNVQDPCLNCKALINLYGGNEQNFLRTNGRAGAPP